MAQYWRRVMAQKKPSHQQEQHHHSTIFHCISRIGRQILYPWATRETHFVTSPLFLQLTPQFSSVAQSCPTLCNPMDCSRPGFPVHHQLPEFTQAHVHWVSDAIQLSHPLSPPSPPSLSLSQYRGLFQWVGCSHQMAKVLELQLQHQFFQRIFRTDFLAN